MIDFPGGSDGKASAYNAGDPGLIPGLGRNPGEGNGNPLQYSCLEKSHGCRGVVGYNPWGCKESDTTEQLHFPFTFTWLSSVQFSSVAQSCPILCDPHELQHARPPCPSPTPRVHSNSCPSSRWCHSAVSSSVVPFSSYPQSLPASESFPMSQLFAWGGFRTLAIQ